MDVKKFAVVIPGVALALGLAACGSSTPTTNDSGSSSSGSPSPSNRSKGPVSQESPTIGTTPKPFNASGLLGGNVTPHFPAGKPGGVSIVAVYPLEKDRGILPFAYRNNTDAGISHVDFTATARLNGKLVGSGQSQGSVPAQVQPGEIGLAYIFFENAGAMPTTGLKYEFTANTLPADTSAYNTAPLTVTEANSVGGSIVGTAVNKTGKVLIGPYGVDLYCFAGNEVVNVPTGFAHPDNDLAPNGKVSFSLDLFGDKCDKFTVGVSGYFK